MLYPVYVYPGNEATAYAVEFPDFPGCFAASDTMEGLPAAVQEAVEAHFYDDPAPIPAPSSLESLAVSDQYQGGAWMLFDVDLSRVESTPQRLNISLPSNLVARIDDYTSSHGLTRSGFLASAAEKVMAEEEAQVPAKPARLAKPVKPVQRIKRQSLRRQGRQHDPKVEYAMQVHAMKTALSRDRQPQRQKREQVPRNHAPSSLSRRQAR